LIIANQLVLLVQLIRELGYRVPQLGVERAVEQEVGLRHGVKLLAIRAEHPQLVPLERATEIDVVIVVAIDLVAVRADRRVVERRRHRVLVRDVRALQRVVVPVKVVFTLEGVAARAGDELALHARIGHFGRLAARAEERFLE
jgi:hypothetical protein